MTSGKRGCFCPTQIFWFRNYVNSRRRHQLGVTTVASITKNVVVATKIIASRQTLKAMPARDARLQHYFIAGMDPGNQLANFAHHAGNVVAENVRQRNLDSRQTAARPDVEMIQSAGFDFN